MEVREEDAVPPPLMLSLGSAENKAEGVGCTVAVPPAPAPAPAPEKVEWALLVRELEGVVGGVGRAVGVVPGVRVAAVPREGVDRRLGVGCWGVGVREGSAVRLGESVPLGSAGVAVALGEALREGKKDAEARGEEVGREVAEALPCKEAVVAGEGDEREVAVAASVAAALWVGMEVGVVGGVGAGEAEA